jgi:hypothetical protein
MTLDARKLSGTGMSPSHIGKANVEAIVAATQIGQPIALEPPDPVAGGWSIFVSDGSGVAPRNALACKFTDLDGVVHVVPLGTMGGPGPLS